MNRVLPLQHPVRPPREPSVARGAVMMMTGCAVLTGGDACMKALVAGHPVGQIVSMRGAIGLGLLLAISPMIGGVAGLKPRNLKGSFILAALLVVSLFLFPTSLRFIPLADAIMLAYLSPVFVAMLSPLFLGEHVGWRRWSAVALGLCGAAFVIRPDAGGLQLAVLIPLTVAVFVALRDMLTRRVIHGESPFAMIALANLGAAVLAPASFGAGWTMLSGTEWMLLSGAAFSLTASQVVMVAAFRHADATVLSCLKYSSIVWAAALGWIFFSEAPGVHDWIGAALIALSGVIITLRTRKKTGAAT